MTDISNPTATGRRGGIPRGLLNTGPVLFSYGFRPFFLGAGIWAATAMALWIASLFLGTELAGDYGARSWHAHEMLFGFGSAVLAGFLLTAVPNWTGRLPVSGRPLAALFSLWVAGRVALLATPLLGAVFAAFIEATFLPALLLICVREIVAGKKWSDLKVMAGLGALSLANICFHYETIALGGPENSPRLATSAFVMLIIIIGGRILPSFTRNWLNKQKKTNFPVPYNRYDMWVILLTIPVLAMWVIVPESPATGIAGCLAAAAHFIRLWRWRGWQTIREPLVGVLHAAYLFVVVGLAAIAASAFGWIDPVAALHVLTVGTVTSMMLAVMTRATRGHTGRELTASPMTCLAYVTLFLCAVVRPTAALAPDHLEAIYALAGTLWLATFALFLVEYGPMLILKRRTALASN